MISHQQLIQVNPKGEKNFEQFMCLIGHLPAMVVTSDEVARPDQNLFFVFQNCQVNFQKYRQTNINKNKI